MSTSISYVALLRGINVGGKNLVSMASLKETFEKLGFSDVRTYLNSGNVLFATEITDPLILESKIEEVLIQYFPEQVRVIVRSAKEVQAILAQTPKSWRNSKDKKCNIIFLRHAIDVPAIVDNFKPKPDIEELHYAPGVLYWSAKLDGLTRSSMVKLSSFAIYQDMTIRRLNTIRKIGESMQESAA